MDNLLKQKLEFSCETLNEINNILNKLNYGNYESVIEQSDEIQTKIDCDLEILYRNFKDIMKNLIE